VLGECPIHDAATGDTYWIDIADPAVYWLSAAGVVRHAFERPLASLYLCGPQQLLVAARAGFFLLDARTGRRRALPLSAPIGGEERYNDGRSDAQGRLWISTMDRRTQRPIGSIASIGAQGRAHAVAAHAVIGNGICFSPDGAWMYFSDSAGRAIHRYRAAACAAELGPRERLLALDGHPGRPDGCAVDADGCLWSARIGGGRIDRYAPDGRLVDTLALPVANPTHCAFGGSGLKTLFVTTSRMSAQASVTPGDPLDGAVLAFDLGIQGLPEPRLAEDVYATALPPTEDVTHEH